MITLVPGNGVEESGGPRGASIPAVAAEGEVGLLSSGGSLRGFCVFELSKLLLTLWRLRRCASLRLSLECSKRERGVLFLSAREGESSARRAA